MELVDVVLHNSFGGRVEVKGCVEWCEVLHLGGCPVDEMVPVCFSDLSIPETEQNIAEQDLAGILTCLAHDLIQNNGMIKELICCAALVRERCARHYGVERQIHHWRQLAKISKKQAGAPSKQLISSVWKQLSQPAVDLSKEFPSHHGHLVDDEVLDRCQCLLHSLELVSLQVLEVTLGWETQEGVQCVAVDVESSHSGGCCYTHFVIQEHPQAVYQVGLPSPSCARDYHVEWWWRLSLYVPKHDIVSLKLFSCEVVGVSSGGESVLGSRLPLLSNKGWHLL